MGSVNKATLIGNLGQNAELKYTAGGKAVATISVATTEQWHDKTTGAKAEKTEWHRCVLWDKVAESLAEYLTKGKQVYIEGRIQSRKWTDKNQIERTLSEIHVSRIVLLGSGGGVKKSTGPVVPHPAEVLDVPSVTTDGTTDDDDEIPF